MVLFAVFMLCAGVQGSDLVATLALGQHNLVTMSTRKFLSVLGLQFLCVFCVAFILVLEEKRRETHCPQR